MEPSRLGQPSRGTRQSPSASRGASAGNTLVTADRRARDITADGRARGFTADLPLRRFALSAALLALLTAAACAQGQTFEGAGGNDSSDDASSSTAATTSATSSQATTTTSATTSGTGGAGSTSSTTSTGGACSEDPCKLVSPQCGCAASEACSIDANGDRACVDAGNVGLGAECSLEACEAGLLCVQTKATPPIVSTCAKFCATDSDCQGPGGLCVLGLNDGMGGTLDGVVICTQNCDPVTNTGCPIASTACQLAREPAGQKRFFTLCQGAGPGTQNAACTTSDECAPDYGCFTLQAGNSICLRWCNVNQPSCPGGTTCNPITIDMENAQIGAVQYGACL